MPVSIISTVFADYSKQSGDAEHKYGR